MIDLIFLRRQPKGSAIFLALILLIGAAALLAGVLSASTNNIQQHDRYTERSGSYLAAHGVARMALQRIAASTGSGIGNYSKKADLTNYLAGGTTPSIGNAGQTTDSTTGLAESGNNHTFGWGQLFAPSGIPYGYDVSKNPTGTKFGVATILACDYSWQESAAETSGCNFYFITVRVKAQNTLLYDVTGNLLPQKYSPDDPPSIVSETIQIAQNNNSNIFAFVTLAKNVSCTLCHTSFGTTDQYFQQLAFNKVTAAGNSTAANDLATEFGTFQRTKIASLGNFEVRLPGATSNTRFSPSNSSIDGTLYSRGIVMDSTHTPITSVDPLALQSVQMGDGQYGTSSVSTGYAGKEIPYVNPTTNFDEQTLVSMQQNKTTGQMVPAALNNLGNDSVTGKPNQQQYANLYLQYPTLAANQTDGNVPVDFPYPFLKQDPTDSTGKTYIPDPTRLVTTQDLLDMVQNRKSNAGDPSNPNQLGKIDGGFAVVVPNGGTYPAAFGTRLPDPVNGPVNGTYPASPYPVTNYATSPMTSDYVDGNLVLIGTKDNPVNLNQQVFVNGDVIIKGYYTGQGSTWATGNIYMPSDTQYKNDVMLDPVTKAPLYDANNQPIENFGVKNNSTGEKNLGGFIAGKTIIVGDYLTSSLGNQSNGGPVTDLPPDYNGTDTSSPVPSLGGSIVDPNAGQNGVIAGVSGMDPYPTGSNLRPGYEVSFPLIPQFQTASSTTNYTYYQLDNTSNPATSPTYGKYIPETGQVTSKNFTLAQMEVFNRDEFAHTQQYLPGNDGNFTLANQAYGAQVFDTTTGNFTYDPTKPYLPRYYTLNPGDPVNAFIYQNSGGPTNPRANDGAGDGTYWVNPTPGVPAMWQGSEMSKAFNTLAIGGPNSAIPNTTGVMTPTNLVYDSTNTMLVKSGDPTNTQQAAVISLNPSWMPTKTMWNLLLNEEWDRKYNTQTSQSIYGTARDGTPLRVDGMLYTNNAIFGIQRNRVLDQTSTADYTIHAINGTSTTPVDPSGNPLPIDTTQPGPYITPQPVDNYTADTYTGTVAIDEYQTQTATDRYNYTNSKAVYNMPQYKNQYNVQQYTYTWASASNETDTYSIVTYTDNYYYATTNYLYSKSQSFVLWSQPAAVTYNWLLHLKDQYGNVITPDTPYTTSTSGTPVLTGYNGNTVLSVNPGSPPSTSVAGNSQYVLAGNSAPGGYTVQGGTIAVNYTAQVTTYGTPTVPGSPASGSYSGTALPALAAGFFNGVSPSTSAGANVTSTKGPYVSGGQPAAPNTPAGATWLHSTTFTTSVMVNTSITYTTATTPPAYSSLPTKPAAYMPTVGVSPWTKTYTASASSVQTKVSYGGPPTPPAGYPTTANTQVVTSVVTFTPVYPVSSTNYNPVYSYGVTTGVPVAQTTLVFSNTYTTGGTVWTPTGYPAWGPYSFALVSNAVTGSVQLFTTTYTYTGAGTVRPPNPFPTLYTSAVPATVINAATITYGTTYLITYSPDVSARVVLPNPPNVLLVQNYSVAPYPQAVTTVVARVGGNPGPRPFGYYGPGHTLVGTPSAPTADYPVAPVSGAKDAQLNRIYGKETVSSSRGRLNVNGAVIAPDLGLLVTGRVDPTGKYPSNLILNYDKRIPNLLQLPSLTINPWNYQNVGISRVRPGVTGP